MKLQRDTGDARYMIRGYSEKAVLINDAEVQQSIIIMPDCLVADWPPQSFTDLSIEHLEAVALLQPEVVVLGTGQRTRFPPAEVMRPLIDAAIGYEVMDTRAACRCYAVLVAEGRKVAAALLPPNAE